ncbi:MAG: hypothetical protein JWN76_2864 [Chitinophagaceae bacterium]|nr:hypothetical protein [Chitinophagaceae bacterium]
MSFQNISLPENVIAALYKDSLVVMEQAVGGGQLAVGGGQKLSDILEEVKPGKKIQPKKWFLGDNKKGIVILVNDKNAVFLSDNELQLLTQILGACKLNVGDTAIINTATTTINYAEVHKELQGKYYFLFGMDANEFGLPLRFPHFQIQQYNNSSFLISPSLSEMLEDSTDGKMKKSKLWLCLKQVFNV